MSHSLFRSLSVAVVLALSAAACGRSGGAAPGGPPGGGMPPMPVEVQVLSTSPVEQASEFIATLKSRRSTTIQPQVEGFVTRIAVRSGDKVNAGAVLFEVDSAPQQAALLSMQSMRAARAAELEYAQQQSARMKALYAAGAVSLQEQEQADTLVRTAAAQLKSIDEQLSEQKAQLGYFRVTAPAAGIVGDVPVRVGDRVTSSTVLTTVDDNNILEIYVNVPVQQAPKLKLGLPVRILDDTGAPVAANAVTFVSPVVDDATQSVLVKAPLVDGKGQYRADQFLRVRLIWSESPGLTIPVTAVTRINGQYFVFVAEKAGEGFVARQKPVQLGSIVGNTYVLQSGLKAGEQLIVGGIQKIGDGAPVMVGAPPAAEKKAS